VATAGDSHDGAVQGVVFTEGSAACRGVGDGIDGDAGDLGAGVAGVAEVVFVELLLLVLGVLLVLEDSVGEGAVGVVVVRGGGGGGGAGGTEELLLLLLAGIGLVGVSLHGYCRA